MRLEKLVGVAGFEPATPSSRTRCITPNPLIFKVSPTRFTPFCSAYFTGFLGIPGRVPATFSRAIERFVDSILKVRVVVPVVFSQRLLRHPQKASRVVQLCASLHQPGRRCVSQNVRNDVGTEACITSRAFPCGANLACQRTPVHVHDVVDCTLCIEPMPSFHVC